MFAKGQRQSGILLPVFSIRREGDLGIGDTRGLIEWIDWAAGHHVAFLQLLPVNEQGLEESPYSALSSAALDPIYLTIDVDELPWIDSADLARTRERAEYAIRSNEVNYPLVRQVKREILELAWSNYQEKPGPLAGEFAAFRAEEADWLDDYCLFRFLMLLHGESLTWDKWPANSRTPAQARELLAKHRRLDTETTDCKLGFFAFVQWLCFRQWRAVRAHADSVGVKLMGDIPIGVNRHSCDVFFNREDFHLEWCGGTPPEGIGDAFINRWGQNWGIPLYRWDQMEKNGYQWWRGRVRRTTRIFRMFRVDHILGFYRIYAFPWLPTRNHEFAGLSHDEAAAHTGGRLPAWFQRPDDTEENRAANLADGDRNLRGALAETEGVEIIAEDLGWTPDYVRPHLAGLGIAGCRIPHWDCNDEGHPTPGRFFPENSFACYSTHDHDPISGIWRNCLACLRRHQEHPTAEHGWQADGARNALRIISEFAEIPSTGPFPPFTEGMRLRLIKALLNSNARYTCLMITELFALSDRINEPGTASGNWTFRMPWTVAQIRDDPQLAAIGQSLSNLILVSRRAPAAGGFPLDRGT